MANLWRKKNIHQLVHDASDPEKGLKRTIGTLGLIALGIGAIIGAGLFTSTAEAVAFHTGPAVSISFLIAGTGCALAGLCYAEFASMIPIAGSAYTYAYATMGEFIAWIIGWDLVLEYGVASAKVATSWSEYLNKLLGNIFHVQIPYEFSHSPFQTSEARYTGIMNLPALFIILLLSLVLIRGVKGSSMLNSIIVIIKVGIVLLFIAFGWSYINPENYTPYIPANTTGVSGEFGWTGLFAGAQRCVLCLHRIRRGVNRSTGIQESATRYAQRNFVIAADLRSTVYPFRACTRRRCQLQRISDRGTRSLRYLCDRHVL